MLISGTHHDAVCCCFAQVEAAIRNQLEDVTWSKGLTIQVEEPKKFASLNTVAISQTTLTNVGHIIGVSSCKGEVRSIAL